MSEPRLTETRNDLPRGWAVARVGDVADYINGLAFKPSDWGSVGRPIIRIQNLTRKTSGYNFTTKQVEDAFVVVNGTILVSWSATLEAFIWTGPEAVLNQHIFKVVPCSPMRCHSFVFWGLKNAILEMRHSEHTHGTTMRHINRGPFLAHPFLLPPLPEQHRIVEAIESYFTRLDDAIATLERVQRNLKRYRASVLKAAVEGRLVPTEAQLARAEGRDYEPASVLLERILSERRRRWEKAELAKMEAKGKAPNDDKWKAKYKEPEKLDTSGLPPLPEGWCWATLDNFLVDIEAGKNFKCEERPPKDVEVGVVKISSVTWGTFDEDESKTCTRSEFVREDYFIRPGDFLISRANTIELVGACVIVQGIRRTLMLSDKVLRFTFAGNLVAWHLWTLRSWWGRSEIECLATGNQESMRNISQASLRRIRVPLPPAEEADRIVQAIDSYMSVAGHTLDAAAANGSRCTRLRQSILKWAFEGRLVDQDPSDEPATALLERIKAEREAATTKKSKRKPHRKKKEVSL